MRTFKLVATFARTVDILVMQRGNLFGHNANKKGEDSRYEEQRTHVGETPNAEIGVKIITDSGKKKPGTDRQEQFLRGIERTDLDDDQQESHPVPNRAYMTFPRYAPGGGDRQIGHTESGAKKTHRDGSWIGKTIGKQIQEFSELVRFDNAKSGGQVFHRLLHHPGSKATKYIIRNCPVRSGMGAGLPRPHHHVVALRKFSQQARDILRPMLSVGIHK